MRGSAYGGIDRRGADPERAGDGRRLRRAADLDRHPRARRAAGSAAARASPQAPDDGLAAAVGTGGTGYGADTGTGYLVDLETAATAVTTTATQVGAAYRDRGASADDPLADVLAGTGNGSNSAGDRASASRDGRGAADADYVQAEYSPADYNPASYNSEPPMLVLGPVADPSGAAAEFGLVDHSSEPATSFRPVTDFGPVTDYGPANDFGRAERTADTDAGLTSADQPVGWPAARPRGPRGRQRRRARRPRRRQPLERLGWLARRQPGRAGLAQSFRRIRISRPDHPADDGASRASRGAGSWPRVAPAQAPAADAELVVRR